MAYTIFVDPDVNCAFSKFYGAFDIGEWKDSVEEMVNHPDYCDGMNVLRDARDQIIPSDVSYETIANQARDVMILFDHMLEKCRWGIVVDDGQSYAKVHQYLAARRLIDSPIERKLFRDMQTAKEWLGLPGGYEIKYPEPGEMA